MNKFYKKTKFHPNRRKLHQWIQAYFIASRSIE